MDPARRTYLIANSPDWMLMFVLAWMAVREFGWPWWAGAAVLGAWILKDLLLYPTMRRYYQSEPAERKMVGARGVTLTPLSPKGFVRVNGEIWQAEQTAHADRVVPQGARVCVRDIRGLLLFVEPI